MKHERGKKKSISLGIFSHLQQTPCIIKLELQQSTQTELMDNISKYLTWMVIQRQASY